MARCDAMAHGSPRSTVLLVPPADAPTLTPAPGRLPPDAFICYQAGKGDDITTRYGALVQIMIGGMFGSAQPMILALPLERPIFLREYATNTYAGSAYFLSKMAVELPMSLVAAWLVMLITYWTIAFEGQLYLFVLCYWVLGLVSSSAALLLGSLAQSTEVAMEITPLIFVPQLLFAGFLYERQGVGYHAAGRLSAKHTRRPRLTLPRPAVLYAPAVLCARGSIKISQIPAWLRWAQWLCSLKFTLNLVMGTEFAECAQQDTQIGADCAFLLEANEVNLDAQWRDAVRAPRPRAARCCLCLAPREMSGLRAGRIGMRRGSPARLPLPVRFAGSADRALLRLPDARVPRAHAKGERKRLLAPGMR